MSGYIYAMATPSGLIKFGYTDDLHCRAIQLRREYGAELRPLGYARGSLRQEHELLRLLAGACERRELFRPTKLITRVIAMLAPWPAEAGAARPRGRYASRAKAVAL